MWIRRQKPWRFKDGDLNSTLASASTTDRHSDSLERLRVYHMIPRWSRADSKVNCAFLAGRRTADLHTCHCWQERSPEITSVFCHWASSRSSKEARRLSQTFTVWHVWHERLRLMHSTQLKSLLSGAFLWFIWFFFNEKYFFPHLITCTIVT